MAGLAEGPVGAGNARANVARTRECVIDVSFGWNGSKGLDQSLSSNTR